jgi:hypothetical protein
VTGTGTRVTHDAECPEIAPVTCAEQELPLHLHIQGISLFRLQPRVTIGFGKGFQLGFRLPIDLKRSTIRYELVDGSPYAPPYGNTHHRTETLFGLGDGQVQFGLYGAPPATPLLLGVEVGVVVPTGKTEEDPFELAAREEEHQHLQFGGGTFDPTLSLSLVVRTRPFGLLANGSGRFPLYENPKGYRGSISLDGTVGATFRPASPLQRLQLLLLLHLSHQEPERWRGMVGENSGRNVLGVSLGAVYGITPRLTLHAQVRANVLESAEGAQFAQPVVLSLGVSGLIDLPKPPQAQSGRLGGG